MEELNDRCEVLMELSACSWVRDSTVQLQATYTNLLTTVQVCVWKYLPFVIVVDFCDRFCLLLLPYETVVCVMWVMMFVNIWRFNNVHVG